MFDTPATVPLSPARLVGTLRWPVSSHLIHPHSLTLTPTPTLTPTLTLTLTHSLTLTLTHTHTHTREQTREHREGSAA